MDDSREMDERYRTVDLPFYRQQVAPVLPEEVLDFHAHAWTSRHWREVPWQTDASGARYMVTREEYTVESLLADEAMLFPDRLCSAVCFGYPTPAADLDRTNEYTAAAAAGRGLFPLRVTTRGRTPRDELARLMRDDGFFGYKVLLNWHGDDYGSVTIEDMLGPAEMELADDLRLVVLWHVPGAGRLTDPEVQRGLREYARRWPNASIVLAHCGRCYLPDQMRAAAPAIADLDNVYLDTSMVMDPLVLQIVFEHVDSRRVLFGTDLPVAAMRGRRVYVMDHWVDVVLEGYPPSAYRVAGGDIRATFMAWEIVAAIRRAAEPAGLPDDELRAIFHDNGMALIEKVMDGAPLARAKTQREKRR